MLDFLRVATRQPKKGVLEIYPKFIYCPSSDLMVRGGDFYAIWDEKKNLWSTDYEIDTSDRSYQEATGIFMGGEARD